MNTKAIKMKRCIDCKELFPKTKEYFTPIITPYGTRIFQSYCRVCANLKRKEAYHKKRSEFSLDLKKSRPAFTVNSLKNNRCARCNNPLEKRDLKYEPEASGEILGQYIYYNCPFCGQDYYPEEKGACELVGSGTL